MKIVKSIASFEIFSTMKAFPLGSATICEACDLSNPSNLVSFFLFVQQVKASDSQKKGHLYVLEPFKFISW